MYMCKVDRKETSADPETRTYRNIPKDTQIQSHTDA